MLSIRFTRVGKKGQPTYRLIVVDKHKDPWGRYLELLGNYNPKTKTSAIKAERIKYWLSVGAQASSTVHNFLIKQGVTTGKNKRTVRISKVRQGKMDKKKAESAAAKAEAEKTPAAETPKE
ncbi:MAG: 30S ribosomal protein S16 [Candidatus Komeilibacteria bacterium]|nr:30S ribosomal protein S16 [Candidatus Komeilibacteria bacterium]